MGKNLLAINGGEKIIKNEFSKYNSIGQEEVEEVKKVYNIRSIIWLCRCLGR